MLTRIFHITLAVLLFISSTGFVVNKHYCQDELKSMALFIQAEACHKEKAVRSCPFHASPHEEGQQKEGKKGCCDDKAEYVKSDDEQLAQSFKIDLELNPVLVSAINVPLSIELPSIDEHSLHYLNYKPPLIVFDIPVRLQTFLC